MLHVKRWQDVTSLLIYILNVNGVKGDSLVYLVPTADTQQFFVNISKDGLSSQNLNTSEF
jgi:hypothetical protein